VNDVAAGGDPIAADQAARDRPSRHHHARRLFASSDHGDRTRSIDRRFDTTTGPTPRFDQRVVRR
jgi:hypothetical protein